MVASGALTGWISLGALASAAPRDVVGDAVAAAGSGAKRSGGRLPPDRRGVGTMQLKRYPGGKLCKPTVTELFS